MYQQHLSYIKNFSAYAKKFSCKSCSRHFRSVKCLNQHENRCQKRSRYVYPGSYYSFPQSIFERLQLYGFDTNPEDRYYPFLATFDMESLLLKSPTQPNMNENTIIVNSHHPVSVAVASNISTLDCQHTITGQNVCIYCKSYKEPTCFINTEPEQLIEQFVQHLRQIQRVSSQYMLSKFSSVISKLNKGIEILEGMKTSPDDDKESVQSDSPLSEEEALEDVNTPNSPVDPSFQKKVTKQNCFQSFVQNLCEKNQWQVNYLSSEDENSESENENEPENENETENFPFEDYSEQEINRTLKIYKKLLQDLEAWCCILPVLGFNSAKYDLKLINKLLPQKLGLIENKHNFIVKR